MTPWRSVSASALCLAMLTGCGGTRDPANEGVRSIHDLIGVVQSAGWKCIEMLGDDEDGTRDSLSKYGLAAGSCDSGAVVIFASDAKREQLEAMPQNALTPGQCRLDARNWAATGTQYMVEDLQNKLGGKGAKTCG